MKLGDDSGEQAVGLWEVYGALTGKGPDFNDLHYVEYVLQETMSLDERGTLRISQPPPALRFDAPSPVVFQPFAYSTRCRRRIDCRQ